MSKRCEICSMDFIDDYSFQGHLLGKKHAKNLESEKLKIQREQNSIFVSPTPRFATPQSVFTFFSQYGPIQHYTFNPRYLIIEYKDKTPVDYLLNNQIFMNKWKLKIQRRKIENAHLKKRKDRKTAEKQKNTDEKSNEEIELVESLKSLESEKTFDEQIEKFMNLVQPNEEELYNLSMTVCKSLDNVLKGSFPRCRAIPFGSSMTGLALIGSDLDVFLDIGEEIHEDEKTKLSPKSTAWTPKTIFREVKSVLFKNSTIFTKIILIPLAKIPIIKFRHTPTGIDCDLSFKHGLGVYNSQLIKYLLTLDARIKPLIIIIKYWAKKSELSGCGKITNYSLVMLIIFYLQQPSINILPTIKQLQKTVPPIYNRGWQINFDTNYQYKDDTKTYENTIQELLEGFFKFCLDFDFSSMVICPLDGNSYTRIDFKKKLEESGGNVESLQLTRPACLQDPIQLDHNIVSGWLPKHLQGLKCCCAQALQNFQPSDGKTSSLLPSLIDPVLKPKTKKARSICFAILAGKFEKFGLPDDFDEKTDDDDETKQKLIEKNWFCMIFKILEAILEKVFIFEIQIIYDAVGLKQMKLEEESDVHTNDCDKIMFSCSGKYCLNRSRKGRIPSLDPSLSPIEKETIISNKILEDLKEKKDTDPIKFTCTIEKKSNPLQAFITMIDNQFTNKSFREISDYMRSKIPSIVDKQLMHMVQFKKKLS